MIAVVQPHRYTRLDSLFDEFCTCMNDAGTVIVADVYAAGEAPIPGVDRDALVDGLRARGHRRVVPLPGPDDLAEMVHSMARQGDFVVCLGAGTITTWAAALPGAIGGTPGRQHQADRLIAPAPTRHLAERLPQLRGRVTADAELAPATWFRVGGMAEALVRPAGSDDLSAFLAALPLDVPVQVLGAASNVIVRDGGIPGVVLRLVRGFADIAVEADGVVAGAACLDATVAEHAAAAGLTGLEFLSGIPGSVGGAVAMNAGAYGGDVAACLDWVDVVVRSGEQVRLPAPALAFAYRHASLPPGAVVVRARFRAQRGDPASIAATMAGIRTSREATQPVRARTAAAPSATRPT